MKKIICLLISVIAICSCTLDEEPQAQADKSAIFDYESGLQTYAYSFYENLPSIDNGFRQDAMSDYGAVSSPDAFIRDGAYTAESSSGWSRSDWGILRNINYFIANCTSDKLTDRVKNNYIGIARFFRAYFYYNMLKRFGDLPWIDTPLTEDDDRLYAGRDSRTVIVQHIIEDLDFAGQNITRTSDASGTLITKWIPYAFKSRVCLFEGTFRKYHTELNLQGSANELLQQAAEAAKYVMDNSPYSIYTGEGVQKSFRALFLAETPITQEVMLADVASESLGQLGQANWWWTSGTYGQRFSLTRTFINTFLKLDGTPYTDTPGYETQQFYDECQNRDYRLAQTIRTPGYTRDGKPAAPNFNGYSYTGYQPIKYCQDPTSYDDGALNTNNVPIFRFAEVLLNYAEAKAELGTLTDADWAKTIGTLRARAGITGGLDSTPTQVDSYLQQTYFPDINDPVILEVRRERSIELALEGFRFDDLRRWKRGELLTIKWVGMYVPGLNQQLDLDHDGTTDVIFFTDNKPTGLPTSCTPIQVGEGTNFGLSNGTYGNLIWQEKVKRTWYADGRQYLYPIPASAIILNGNLKQNPGW